MSDEGERRRLYRERERTAQTQRVALLEGVVALIPQEIQVQVSSCIGTGIGAGAGAGRGREKGD